jgi:hypothetical protein
MQKALRLATSRQQHHQGVVVDRFEVVQEDQGAKHVVQTWEQGKLMDLGMSQLQKLQPTSQAMTQVRPTPVKLLQGIETEGLLKKAFATEIEKPAAAMMCRDCPCQLRGLQGSIATDQKEAHSPALAASKSHFKPGRASRRRLGAWLSTPTRIHQGRSGQ